jgi:hypothetical protein
VAEGIRSLNLCEKRTIPESNFNLARVNLTHTLGTSNDHSEATVSLIFRVMDQDHHKRLQDRMRHYMIVLLSATQNILPHIGACVQQTNISSGGNKSICRANQVLGLPVYHISRHVASTFKRLTTTTTHCDLINFYRHRRGNLPSHDTAHDPVHHPYSDCRIVSILLLYRASDRKSPDFYRSY